MSSGKPDSQQTSWSSIMRDPAISKLLVNLVFSGLSYGVYNNLVYFFLVYLDPVGFRGDFGIYYLVFQILMAAVLPLAGVLTDKIGRKPMLILGATTSAIGTFILPLATVWWHLVYASAAQAIGFALLGPAQNCVVADVTRGYRREKGYSITMSFGMVFGVVGTVALIIYSALYENVLPAEIYHKLPLMISAILALIAVVPMLMIRIPRQPKENELHNFKKDPELSSSSEESADKDHSHYEPARSLWKNSVVLKMITFQMIIGFGAGFLVPFFNYYWYQIFPGLPQAAIYTIALLGELGVVLGGLSAPWLAKRVTRLGGRVGTTVACQLVSIACAAYLATVPYYSVLLPAVIAFIARQALMNMVNPLMTAMTMDHTPEDKRGRVSSLTALGFNLPNGISPLLSDQLISSFTPQSIGYTYSALVLVSTYITGTALLSTTRKKDKLLVKQTRQTKD